MKKFLLVFGIAFLLFSCEKESGIDLMNSENANNQDLLLKSGKPDQPGDNGKVIRFPDNTYGWWLIDEKNNLTAFVGVDATKLCSGDIESYDIKDFQLIIRDKEHGNSITHAQIKGDDVMVQVYEGAVFTCSDALFAEPFYTGTGQLVYTDNDWYADGPNINSFGLRLNGSGISVSFHMMFDGENQSIISFRARIMLK